MATLVEAASRYGFRREARIHFCPMGRQFDSVTIIGVGLLGASLGLALKERGLVGKIMGVGRKNSSSLATARRHGAIDMGLTDAAVAVRDSDLVILASRLGQFPGILEKIAAALPSGALVSDVGSTKAQVLRWAAQLLPAHVDFIGAHPMAGSEKRGPEFARADLFEDALCLICPPRAPHGASRRRIGSATRRIEALWRAVGMKTRCLDADTHDRWVAAISHLPHATAAALMLTAGQTPEAFTAVAGGFLDSTRIASGDPGLWSDIFLTNPMAVNRQLEALVRRLQWLHGVIRRGDQAALENFLGEAKRVRDGLIGRQQRRYRSGAMASSTGEFGVGERAAG